MAKSKQTWKASRPRRGRRSRTERTGRRARRCTHQVRGRRWLRERVPCPDRTRLVGSRLGANTPQQKLYTAGPGKTWGLSDEVMHFASRYRSTKGNTSSSSHHESHLCSNRSWLAAGRGSVVDQMPGLQVLVGLEVEEDGDVPLKDCKVGAVSCVA